MVKWLLFFLLSLHGAVAKHKHVPATAPAQKWLTLGGDGPIVVARQGYSGIFPEASEYAYQFATTTSLMGTALLCDLQLTKDGQGICRSDLRLDNATNIEAVFPKGEKTYTVNGEPVRGWFSIDYTANQLFNNVTLIQNILSRPSAYDATLPMSTVQDVTGLRPIRFWLNVQYAMFFKEHNLDVAKFVLDASSKMGIQYISSPEVDFLKTINGKLGKSKAKLVFRFLDDENALEPSTKKKYSDFLQDLSSIKAFASGILVPKQYIWPVTKDGYLQPHTNLVVDAHKAGLEVYAFNFANDMPGSYNYSYDPTAEYLQFVDNPDFSVDGLLTDFPSTASEAIACLAHTKNDPPSKDKPLIITHNGASGVYAGCTDLAYQQAVADGADIIDCTVQMTKDGLAFCLDSADLLGASTAATTFMSRATSIPEIKKTNGIFSFDLTWSEIQGLKPEIKSPHADYNLQRNPAYKNQGKFLTLPEFLRFAKDKAVPGIMINIENAAYLASKKGLGVIDIVVSSMNNAGFDKQTTQQVLIQSDDASVLSEFKKFPNYKRVLVITEKISDAANATVEEITHFANAVNLPRNSLVSSSNGFLTGFTNIVEKFHAANISVYTSTLTNEFVAIAFDFFSDPMLELNTYVVSLDIDGFVTEFPATATAYTKSSCFDPLPNAPYSMLIAQPGSLLSLAPPGAMPPAAAPAPTLTVDDVVDPPLPPVLKVAKSPKAEPTAAPSGQAAANVNVALCLVMILVSFMCFGYH